MPATRGRAPLWAASAAFWLVILGVVAARAAGVASIPAVATFGIVFSSIVVEALGFILVGAFVSATLAVCVPARIWRRAGRLHPALQVPGAALAGVGFPVCECGSVPVGRRLLASGLHPSAGIAFMVSAPIVNPVVLASTWVAYAGRGRALEMVLARAGLGLVVAVVAGALVGRRATAAAPDPSRPDHADEWPAGWMRWFDHVSADLVFMGRFLVLGAALSAAVQTAVPADVLAGVGGAPVVAALALMAAAFALSLCSEADAFVAVSFTAFPLSAQLAFLTLGPVLDAKLAVLYAATFGRRFSLALAAVAAPIVLVGSLLLGETLG